MATRKQATPVEAPADEPGVAASYDVNADPVTLQNLKRLYALAQNPEAAADFVALRDAVVASE